MPKIDLHLHTTASDGLFTPRRIVECASKADCSIIAITDHDSVDGIAEASISAKIHGIKLIPALELSVEACRRQVHMLGYFIDPRWSGLLNTLLMLREQREVRAKKIINTLNDAGVKIEFKDVAEVAKGGVIGRTHIAKAMVKNGWPGSFSEALSLFLSETSKYYVEKTTLSSEEAIRLIKSAGGVPVLAHPALSQCEDLIPALIEEGIQGIEAIHTLHMPDERIRLRNIARRHGLVVTGGSDCHGFEYPDRLLLGTIDIDKNAVDDLMRLSEDNRGGRMTVDG